MTKSIYALFECDKNLEIDGVDLVFGESTFTVARAGGTNKKYSDCYANLIKPYKRQIQAGSLSEEVMESIMHKAFCLHCLKGWKNVKDREGKVLDFSYENAQSLMKSLPDLFNALYDASLDRSTFQNDDDFQDDAVKKS